MRSGYRPGQGEPPTGELELNHRHQRQVEQVSFSHRDIIEKKKKELSGPQTAVTLFRSGSLSASTRDRSVLRAAG